MKQLQKISTQHWLKQEEDVLLIAEALVEVDHEWAILKSLGIPKTELP